MADVDENDSNSHNVDELQIRKERADKAYTKWVAKKVKRDALSVIVCVLGAVLDRPVSIEVVCRVTGGETVWGKGQLFVLNSKLCKLD